MRPWFLNAKHQYYPVSRIRHPCFFGVASWRIVKLTWRKYPVIDYVEQLLKKMLKIATKRCYRWYLLHISRPPRFLFISGCYDGLTLLTYGLLKYQGWLSLKSLHSIPLIVHVPIHICDAVMFKVSESQNLKNIDPPKRVDTFDMHKDALTWSVLHTWQWKITMYRCFSPAINFYFVGEFQLAMFENEDIYIYTYVYIYFFFFFSMM